MTPGLKLTLKPSLHRVSSILAIFQTKSGRYARRGLSEEEPLVRLCRKLTKLFSLPGSLIFFVPIEGGVPAGNALDA